MIVILALITIIASSLMKFAKRDSMSLTEYLAQNATASPSSENGNGQSDPSAAKQPSSASSDKTGTKESSPSPSAQPGTKEPSPSSPAQQGTTEPWPNSADPSGAASAPAWGNITANSLLTGASLNGDSQLEERISHADGFYYEPVSDKLRRYMTGVSYPSTEGEGDVATPEITFEELRYVHILHYDFEGNPTEGELICNEAIAQDLVEIFYELYRNEYQLEKVTLIDEYDGDDTASMEDNNTSCFNYRPVEGTSSLSKHSFGLAIDINPLYNPYITYGTDGTEKISPVSAQPYADRSVNFPYKIDENDLCYKLFIQHGFTWGGNWNNVKDYQHFQKPLP